MSWSKQQSPGIFTLLARMYESVLSNQHIYNHSLIANHLTQQWLCSTSSLFAEYLFTYLSILSQVVIVKTK